MIRLMQIIKSWFTAAFDNLSLVAAPALSASIFGVTVGAYAAGAYTLGIGIIVGIIAGFGLEAAGYNAFKATQKTGRYLFAVAYIAVGVVVTIAIEYADLQRLIFALSGYAITAVVYASIHALEAADSSEAERQRLFDFNLTEKAKDNEARRQRAAMKAGAVSAATGTVAGAVAQSVTKEVAQLVASGRLHNELPEVDSVDVTIMQLLTATPNATQTQLAEAVGMSRPGLKKRCQRLIKKATP